MLTNISRYDLPDPDTYKDFFNVHPLYDFPSLQSTCTFFKGCPLNKLDIAIAYELPETLTNHKKKVSQASSVSDWTHEPNKLKKKKVNTYTRRGGGGNATTLINCFVIHTLQCLQ